MSQEFIIDLQELMQRHGERLPKYGADGEWGMESEEALERLLSGPKRRISTEGLEAIKRHEGVRLTAYPDPGSGGEPWTIGYGHTGGVTPGMKIDQAQANAYLQADVKRFEDAVNRLAPKTTQGQFDALVSFAFNLGEGNLAKSTLLKKHNAGDYAGAQAEFGKWVNASGRRLPGLVKRRADEAKRYGES